MLKLFVKSLKEHLTEHKEAFVTVNEWCGDTETGFYDEVEFDMDKLLAEIDEFSEGFKEVKGAS